MSGNSTKPENRLYNDLAWLWPLWGTVEDYRANCESAVDLIREHSLIEPRTILDIGCGGGKCAYHLKCHFKLTGIDISEPMLENARKLNPDCEFILGDMRSLDLGRKFDAVFMNDSINYMRNREELRAAFASARNHLHPGAVMITAAEQTKETLLQNTTHVYSASQGNLDVTFIENYYDPDPDDENFEGTFVFLIREDGKLRIESDNHVGGIFPLQVWRDTLTGLGFDIREHVSRYEEEGGRALPVFVCLLPK